MAAFTGMARVAAAEPNYAEALQKSIYFFEAQESGEKSPGNRVEWRGPAHLDDGKDVGRDLAGGWYDAGDHWKAGMTTGYAASLIGWGAETHAKAYQATGQMPHLLNGLRHVNAWFLKCVDDPNLDDVANFEQFKLYIDVGGRGGPDPGVHSVWCGPEVTAGYTVRQTMWLDTEVPGPDMAYLFASAMASNALAIDRYGEQPGDKELARKLMAAARKVYAFGRRYDFNPAHPKDHAKVAGGKTWRCEYRSGTVDDEAIWAATWMHAAERHFAGDAYDGRHLREAEEVVAKTQADGRFDDVFRNDRDLFQGQMTYAAALRLLELAPDSAAAKALEPKVIEHFKLWSAVEPTPGGLQVRRVYNGDLTSKWLSGQILLRQRYATLKGDADPAAREHAAWAKRQLDYLLGSNPAKTSAMIGFGEQWSQVPHSRAAHGAWAGFANCSPKAPEYLPAARHTLYGGVIGGPGLQDEFSPDMMVAMRNEVILDCNAQVQDVLAALVAKDPDKHRPIPDDQFPPERPKNDSLDPIQTDREFFVIPLEAARAVEDGVTLKVAVWNKSAFPPRVTEDLSFRVYFTPAAGADVAAYKADATGPQNVKATVKQASPTLFYIEVDLTGEKMYPNQHGGPGDPRRYRRDVTFTLTGPAGWDAPGAVNLSAPVGEIDPDVPVYTGRKLAGGREPAGR